MRLLTVYFLGMSLSSYLKASVQQQNFEGGIVQCWQFSKAALSEHFPIGDYFKQDCGNGRWHGIPHFQLIGIPHFPKSSCYDYKNEDEHTEK